MTKKKKVLSVEDLVDIPPRELPVLRPLKESISHQKNITGENCQFFTDIKDGEVEGPVLYGGGLGAPCEMDMESISVVLADYTGDDNTILFLASKAKIQLLFGMHSIWLSSKLSDGQYDANSKKFIFDIRSPIDNRPRKVISNEMFMVKLDGLMPELWRKIRVAINGTLYVAL